MNPPVDDDATRQDSGPVDFGLVARQVLRALTEQGVPPVPPNYEVFFADVARQAGVPEPVIERLRTGQPDAVPHSCPDFEEQAARAVLPLVLRVVSTDAEQITPIRRLLRRVLKLLDAGRLEPDAERILDALRSAARRSHSGQRWFDPDDVLPVQALDAPTPPAAGCLPDDPAKRVLAMVLRLAIATGSTASPAHATLVEVQRHQEAEQLALEWDEVLEALHWAAGAVHAIAPEPAGVTADRELTPMDALATVEGAITTLLRLLAPAVRHRADLKESVERRIGTFERGGQHPDESREEIDILALQLGRYFSQGIPAHRQAVPDLVAGASRVLRTLDQRRAALAERIEDLATTHPGTDGQPADLADELAVLKESAVDLDGVSGELHHLIRSAFAQSVRAEQVVRPPAEPGHLDPLTGLPNRSGLQRWLDSVLTTPDGGMLPFSALLISLAEFRERYAGAGAVSLDEALSEAGRRLRDSVDAVDFVGRLGAAAFLVLMPCRPLQAAREAGQELLRAMGADPVPVDGSEVPLVADIGVAEHRPGDGIADTLRRAQRAVGGSSG